MVVCAVECEFGYLCFDVVFGRWVCCCVLWLLDCLVIVVWLRAVCFVVLLWEFVWVLRLCLYLAVVV